MEKQDQYINDFDPDFGNPRLWDLEFTAELDGKVERAIGLLEQKELDITGNYLTWQNLGLAFSYEYKEAGRQLFQRVCRFYPKYSQEECDQMYDRCLIRARGSYDMFDFLSMVRKAGITEEELLSPEELEEQKLFEAELEAAGISPNEWNQQKTEESAEKIAQQEKEEAEFEAVLKEMLQEFESEEAKPGGFPNEVYEELPDFLRRAIKPAKGEHQKSLMLLGSLGVLSSAFPGFKGIYDSLIRPNLYVFVSAPPASGKGILNFCRYLVTRIHRAKEASGKAAREQYDQEMVDFAFSKDKTKEKPQKPAEKMHFIPANNSNTGLLQLLADNEGCGLLFETEADTLVNSLKSEYGNFSDALRKAYHHEEYSYFRRTDREMVRMERPCLSVVLSGTPGQLKAMFPDAENGLFSRFLFYNFTEKPRWQPKFQADDSFDLKDYYEALGEELYGFFQKMENQEVQMIYNQDQKDFFNRNFEKTLDDTYAVFPPAFLATVKRLGVTFFRITMILTALRCMEDGQIPARRECDFWDFRTAQLIILTLLRHSKSVFTMLPAEKPVKVKPQALLKERFLNLLDGTFTTTEFQNLAASLGISKRTAYRNIGDFIIAEKVKFVKPGLYQKL